MRVVEEAGAGAASLSERVESQSAARVAITLRKIGWDRFKPIKEEKLFYLKYFMDINFIVHLGPNPNLKIK